MNDLGILFSGHSNEFQSCKRYFGGELFRVTGNFSKMLHNSLQNRILHNEMQDNLLIGFSQLKVAFHSTRWGKNASFIYVKINT